MSELERAIEQEAPREGEEGGPGEGTHPSPVPVYRTWGKDDRDSHWWEGGAEDYRALCRGDPKALVSSHLPK